MKNFKIVLMALPLFALACSDDGITDDFSDSGAAVSARESAGPANPDNPYDFAGRIHNELLEMMEGAATKPLSVAQAAEMADAAATLHPDMGPAGAGTPVSGSTALLAELAGGGDALADVLAASSLGDGAKASLLGLCAELELLSGGSFEQGMEVLLSYEADILQHKAFTDGEKQVLLVAASVARHAAYRKKRKDKDWETSVSVAAAVAGSQEGAYFALSLTAATAVCRENGLLK